MRRFKGTDTRHTEYVIRKTLARKIPPRLKIQRGTMYDGARNTDVDLNTARPFGESKPHACQCHTSSYGTALYSLLKCTRTMLELHVDTV